MLDRFEGIGERLSLMLKLKKITQKEACELTGISKNAMSNYVNGNRIPESLMLYKLAKLFRTSMEWILTGENLAFDESSESFKAYLRGTAEEIIRRYAHLESWGKNNLISNENKFDMANEIVNLLETYLKHGPGNSRVLVLTHYEYSSIIKFKQLSMEDKIALEEFVNVKLRLAREYNTDNCINTP
ncbi:hypothetical protein SDC9_125561 [bioreactor metagenome]|uniref:HTH cro/C1-type domain-containing protein n=1 Tax=bioreactor metagenome TaxID=1076179 RepID=A0A645CNC2_9ZZZZ|nr:helix-turn-helix transcriptional regulator [Lutispora sp.]MEA4961255.1 helix-turn-helix transcriptional regulator [Lutispora sp.]HCJ57475.1 hypothetical protein [Clostridiaceae bacterium]